MSGITLTEVADATIPTPAAGKVTVYMSVEEAGPAFKDDAAAVTPLQGATGATGATGPTGPAGAGVPPDVIPHGSMGATETFDYDGGDGVAHSGTVNAALTVTLTGWPATDIEAIMSLYLTTDGTGGYGVPTFGAEVVNDADLAAVWDDAASALNVIRLWTIDGGTTVYIAIPEAAATPTLEAVLAVSGAEDIADALTGAAAPDASNVFATMADVGGGGGIPSGTSFPGSPTNNDLFYRTDRDLIYFYDGTRWLTTQMFTLNHTVILVTVDTQGLLPIPADYQIYLVGWDINAYVSASATWVVTLSSVDTEFDLTTIDSQSTAAQTLAQLYRYTKAVGVVIDPTAAHGANALRSLHVNYDEQSGTASFSGGIAVHYRLVG
jgi:hypothetical protein